MNGTHDLEQAADADNGGALNPREAARLLEQTSREARRQFNLSPPLLTALMGGVILVAYGALWLSVREQHPYTGPSLGVIGLVYATVAVAITVSMKVYRRATGGVSGPVARQRTVEGVAILLSYLGSPVLQGALKYYGASDAIVYGVIPAAAPLIIVGTTVAGIAASKADWPQFGAALAVVTGGVAAAFVGPIGAWLVAGIGLFVGVVGYAAATAWQRRAVGNV
ncbi:MAG TPA: hypothetical protein VMV23_04410 [Candidatus Nanopelagicaceae bacterium]|nr:hypothetical protein [Candidatus Nanopelagicaceae bacterium]